MKRDSAARIFVSYAHEDEAWRKVLFKRPLRVPFEIEQWTDAQLQPGMPWDEAIGAELERSTVAILLVSRHFLSSDYIGRKELPVLLKRRVSDGLKLLWIPIGNLAPAQLDDDLAALQSVWPLKKPLPARPSSDPDVVEKTIEEVRYSIEAAIDPVGVPLMRRLSEKYGTFKLLRQTDGTMVYRSRDLDLDRPVVIKALTDSRHRRDGFRQNVLDAVNISDEPNFVHLHDAVLTGDQPYCVMQFIEGQNLRKWIETDNRRQLDCIIRIIAQVTRALVSVHALGLSYGNLKPSNIILSKRNEPFILPMGRRVNDRRGARFLDDLESRSPDAEAIAYLTPEQFDEKVATVSGELSDQYTLGLLAYELITGSLPPTIGNAAPTLSSLAQIRSRGSAAFSVLPLVTQARPECSEMMARIIRRMTSKMPEHRYASLSDLLVDVRRQENVILAQVRQSYARCLGEQAALGRNFFEAVYRNFFVRRKDAAELFRNLGPHQYDILRNALVQLFAFYEQEGVRRPNEPNVMTEVAQKHDRDHKNIAMDFYAPFKESLVDTACGTASCGSAAFDPTCRDDDAGRDRLRVAWHEVLGPGVAYMMGKYQPEVPPHRFDS